MKPDVVITISTGVPPSVPVISLGRPHYLKGKHQAAWVVRIKPDDKR